MIRSFTLTFAFATALSVSAHAVKAERVYSPIKLPKQGFIHLDVLDSFKERRAFLVTCEKTLDSKITDALRQTGVGYHPLKKGEKQSLINHWQTPATDYVIVCEGN